MRRCGVFGLEAQAPPVDQGHVGGICGTGHPRPRDTTLTRSAALMKRRQSDPPPAANRIRYVPATWLTFTRYAAFEDCDVGVAHVLEDGRGEDGACSLGAHITRLVGSSAALWRGLVGTAKTSSNPRGAGTDDRCFGHVVTTLIRVGWWRSENLASPYGVPAH
jgi:hypothetical protein